MAGPARRVLFERLAVAALVSTFILICLGAYVVKIGAGLSCPTWPGCFDDPDKSLLANWVPFLDPDADLHGFQVKQVAAEWTHRLVAGFVSIFVGALAVIAWRDRTMDARVRKLSYASAVFLLTQILLGGVTVLLYNAPWTVVLHQGNAMLVFGTLVALVAFLFWAPESHPRVEAADA